MWVRWRYGMSACGCCHIGDIDSLCSRRFNLNVHPLYAIFGGVWWWCGESRDAPVKRQRCLAGTSSARKSHTSHVKKTRNSQPEPSTHTCTQRASQICSHPHSVSCTSATCSSRRSQPSRASLRLVERTTRYPPHLHARTGPLPWAPDVHCRYISLDKKMTVQT
jgi:hypothetical protein